MLSQRAQRINPSLTLALTAQAAELKRQGKSVISFSTGEPDFITPKYVRDAGHQSIDSGNIKYTAADGLLELKKAIIEKLHRENQVDYDPTQIIVSSGGKSALAHVLMAILDPDDEVLLPAPYWLSYSEIINLNGAKMNVVSASAQENYKVTPEKLKAALTPRTKVLILNSPNNPTGTVYSREEITALADFALENHLLLLSDEIYEKLVYDGVEHFSPAALSPEHYANTIIINGFSKAYAMTGWRLGYAAGPKEIIRAAAKIQSHTTSNPCTISQYAAIEALRQDDGSLEKMRLAFDERRRFIIAGLNQMDGVFCPEPKGAFYAFVDVQQILQKNRQDITTSMELCRYLLENKYLVIVPGEVFGAPGYVRFSYATSMENIQEGLQRFEAGLKEIQ